VSTTAPQTRHTVTALIVAHDGARLLPGLVQAVQAQTYPVDQVVGVDTGSRDRSGAVLSELIGQDAVFGMERSTGYGEAVSVALRHATRRRSGQTDPSLNRVEWIWLLHDDCEPAPQTLERLLRAASRDRSVVVLGPKVLDGQDRRTLREVGVSIDRAGRRITGIDPGEIDQGQHDHAKAVLAVGSAGMLVRRDVWDQLGGFDSRLRLFRDDLDFCWRVQAAGYRVQVVTDAVLYHRELLARRRRPAEGGGARRLDRRNALYVLAVNLPLLAMLRIVGGAVIGSIIKAAYFAATKQLDMARAQAEAVGWLFLHPVRLWQARRRRAVGRGDAYAAVRTFIPPARTLSRLAEKVAGLISDGPPQASGGRHQASSDESEEDEQFVDGQSVMRKIIGNPGVQLFAVLLVVALIAERRLLGTSPLGGGALVPAWGGSGALWGEYLAGFHAVGVGSTASAPPYLAVVAALATVLGGQAWLAVDVLLLGCVPLAGLTAYLATRRLARATSARMLVAGSYALLPVAIGSVAAGRLGTAVAFVLLPLIAISAGRMLTGTPKKARRAAWAVGLLVAVAAAFAPLAWILGVVFALGVLAARRWLLAADPVNAAIVAIVPFFALFPWSLHLLTDPIAFVTEAGVQTAGLTTTGLEPKQLLALSPGGPGLPPVWVTVGFGLALIAVLLPTRRTWVTAVGWCVAIAGFIAAVTLSRITVTPQGGGQPAAGWPGVALALAALGLLLAIAPAAEWLAGIASNERLISPNLNAAVSRSHGAGAAGGAGYGAVSRVLAIVALVAAASAPVLAGLYWVKDGVQGPIGSVTSPLLPAFVSASSTTGQQYRTLILRPNGSVLDYTVVRQGDPSLGEPELTTDSAAEQALSRQVAALGAPDGADAGDPGLVLGSFGIRWVLLPGPVDAALAEQLDGSLGLDVLTTSPSYDLWRVAGPVARVRVIAPDGTVTTLSANPVSMSDATAPAGGGTLELAEPYGGWTATLNGRALKPIAAPVDGWAQGFVLPAGGGKLSISRNDLAREASLLAELIVVLAVCMLALPGKRADPAEQAEAMAALRAARDARRASGGSRLFARSAAGADVADAGVADDELADDELAGAELAGAEAATGEAATGETAGRRGRVRRPAVALAGLGSTRLAMTRRRGGRRKADGQDDYSRDDFGREPFGQDAFGQGELPETVPAAEWPVGATAGGATAGAATTGGTAGAATTGGATTGGATAGGPAVAGPGGRNFAGDRAEQQAPWDMAGNWDGAARRDNADEQWGPTAPWPDRRTGTGTGTQAMPARPTPTPPPGRLPAGREEAAPWETESWGTGPQAMPSGTGPQRPPRWQTGPQAPLSGTGPRPTMTPPDAGQLSTPAGWNRDTGEWERAARAERAEESGRLREPGYSLEDDFPAGPAAGPAGGSGPWPTASAVPGPTGPPSAASTAGAADAGDTAGAGKPERHSHRASKHGRPSRWRGSSDRPGRDGES
jgi:GT2 family glycosyltransferase